MNELDMGPEHKNGQEITLIPLKLKILKWDEIKLFLTVYIRDFNEYITGIVNDVKEESITVTWINNTETIYYKDEFEYIQSLEDPKELILVKENKYNELKPVSNLPDKLKKRIDDIDNFFHLHVCEQEGMLSGQPTAKDWYEGFNQAEQAWKEIKKTLNSLI